MLGIVLYMLRGKRLLLTEILIEWEVIRILGSQIYLTFIFDYLSIFFIGLVSLISGRVLIFRSSYMSKDIYSNRFICIVLLFVLRIGLLIISPNLISLLLGWDGLGVTSYLLVVYYQRNKSYNAGIITALTNRMGDVGLLICIGIILSAGHWTYLRISTSNFLLGDIFTLVLIVSACTKRAQIPFSAWLPAAMAAPTPVSALVHSSTLVTAGVYLLIRFNTLILNPFLRDALIFMGTLTIIIAGFSALSEGDIKKVIALSTLSQLGIIIIALGCQLPLLAYFHLICHAYFKAMLFICAGILIHNFKDYQDLRKIGRGGLPIILRIMIVANISLCGIPFIRGFYSKDLILEKILGSGQPLRLILLILLGVTLTVFYSLRLSFYIRNRNAGLERIYLMDERDKFIIAGIINLMPFAVFGGLWLSWHLFPTSHLIFIPTWIKILIPILILSSILFSRITLKHSKPILNSFFKLFKGSIWFIPQLYRRVLTARTLAKGRDNSKLVERSWLEFILFHKLINGLERINFYYDTITFSYFINSLFLILVLLLVL